MEKIENIEEWKSIPGFEGVYEISNLGRVKSVERFVYAVNGTCFFRKERMLSVYQKKGNKYYAVGLQFNKKAKAIELHRLLAKSFIPNPMNLSDVNHINNIRTDNRIDNLEWVSRRENNSHASAFRKSTSKYVGVSYIENRKQKPWSSHIFYNKKLHHLGYFNTEAEAATKYNTELERLGINNAYSNSI